MTKTGLSIATGYSERQMVEGRAAAIFNIPASCRGEADFLFSCVTVAGVSVGAHR